MLHKLNYEEHAMKARTIEKDWMKSEVASQFFSFTYILLLFTDKKSVAEVPLAKDMNFPGWLSSPRKTCRNPVYAFASG